MSPDRLPEKRDPKKILIGWYIATSISAIATAAGFYGCSRQQETSQHQLCQTLSTRVYSLEQALFDRGTLGSDGGLVIRYLEVRNPDDPNLREWGQMKNEMDKQCALASQENRQFLNEATRIVAMLGLAVTLLGTRQIPYFRRAVRIGELRNKQ